MEIIRRIIDWLTKDEFGDFVEWHHSFTKTAIDGWESLIEKLKEEGRDQEVGQLLKEVHEAEFERKGSTAFKMAEQVQRYKGAVKEGAGALNGAFRIGDNQFLKKEGGENV